MKLLVRERLVIFQLYPLKGNLVEQTLVEDIKKKVKITQEEIKEIGLKVQRTSNEKASYIWNEKEVRDFNVDLTEAELGFLKERVKELDKTKQITQELLSICKKIQEA